MSVVRVDAPANGEEVRGLIASPKDGQYLDLPSGKQVTDVFVTFAKAPAEAASLQMAFWIEAADDPSKRGVLNILPGVPTEPYALRGIGAGAHRIRAALVRAGAAEKPTHADLPAMSPSLETAVTVHVRAFEDFRPSYEWRTVELWHRIPPGLEVRLGLDDFGERSARIPERWQWDVVAAPGTDVSALERQRVEVTATSTLGELKQQLGANGPAWELVWRQEGASHERVLEDSWTATQADLFNYKNDIVLRQKK